eukprot:6476752-Amphidinium_carterae.1
MGRCRSDKSNTSNDLGSEEPGWKALSLANDWGRTPLWIAVESGEVGSLTSRSGSHTTSRRCDCVVPSELLFRLLHFRAMIVRQNTSFFRFSAVLKFMVHQAGGTSLFFAEKAT